MLWYILKVVLKNNCVTAELKTKHGGYTFSNLSINSVLDDLKLVRLFLYFTAV